uniref:NADH-ubiquinone oxidoreductase 51kDa subunit iron-sulphur binding domain-containing protein n=1 Tax=Brevundimonas diminuta TaxID=293 RepID=Q51696_BREDI|nr:unknown [Brevundimonas diminuta]
MTNIFSRDELEKAARARRLDPCEPLAAYRYATTIDAEAFLAQIDQAQLSGKGGANFPSARKMRLFHQQAAPRKYLVVNGGEHEPGSAKDDWLLLHHPDTVIEGALCVAHALGATHILVAVNEGRAATVAAVREAAAAIAIAGRLFPGIEVVLVPDEYVVGEETALLQAVAGQVAKPVRRPPYPIESGHQGMPTLVHNVETLAHVPYLLLLGAEAYRGLGAPGQGVTLCTFGEEFVHAGVRLVPVGIDLNSLLYGYGGGLKSGQAIRAVQPGGPASGFLPADRFDVAFDSASLRAAGSSLGCAAITAYAASDDLVAAARQRAAFFASASCEQCPQCRMQTQMLLAIVRQLESGKANARTLQQIPVIVKANAGKAICGLIDMPVAPIQSLIHYFKGDIDARMR